MAAASNGNEKTAEAKVAHNTMKRYCKNIDITSMPFIESAVFACLAKKCKRERHDTVKLFARICSCSTSEAYGILMQRDERYGAAVQKIARIMRREILRGQLTLPPIHVKAKHDGDSGKIRKISVQHIWQLLYDHVAVIAMRELNKLMGEHQVSGRKGMGGAYGQKLVCKWVQRSSKRVYFVKLDIKHYYESVNTERLMTWVERRVKNPRLMWLIRTLTATGESGLNIGSYLSHFLANLYLSDVWHFAMQRAEGVKHALFYMDDLLLIGSNKRRLRKAVYAIIERIELTKGLQVKPNWFIRACSTERPIDIMGIRFSPRRQTLRKRIFRRARRAFLRLARFMRHHAKASRKLARRVASYNGWFSRTDCKNFLSRIRAAIVMKVASNIINYQPAQAT